MPTIKLIPSTYAVSNTSYLSVSNATNMYTDTDSTTYSTTTNSQTGTTSYYLYIRGFNFDDIPDGAVVNSFTVKLKARESGVSTSSSYSPKLCNNTSQLTSTCPAITTTATTNSFTEVSATWEEILGYGSNFGIRINCRRNNRNTTGYVYVYGAEIEVTYTIPVFHTITATLSTDNVNSIDPAGVTNLTEGSDYELAIYADSIDSFKVEDNGIDVTSSLVQHEVSTVSTKTANDETHSGIQSGSSYAAYAVGRSAEDPYSSTSNMYASNESTGYVDYSFDFSDIPSNATIDSVVVRCYGARENSTINSTHVAKIGLYSDNTLKSTEQEFTSTSNGLITIDNPGTWTRAELQSAKLRFTVGYYGGRMLGITWIVNYTDSSGNAYYWTYTINNVTSDHTIIISDAIIVIPDEDPQYNYYPITISSINATTTPGRGTNRVVEGSNQVITIYPDDPLITLVTDNGVDITNQLVAHGGTIPTPTVETNSGADYGFTLNSSTEYYVSANKGIDKSAAVCKVNFDFPVRCLVTIQYINYAESGYDFGIFGNIDSALTNNYKTASGSMPDNDYKLACNTSSYNTASVQTITYEVPSGEHFLNIKYSKDDATSENNDTLQWKISNIEALESNNYYTYTLSNIDEAHSLIFIFGDVTYYFVNSSGTNVKLFPSGSMVQLPGDYYTLVIIPDDYSSKITVMDNNIDVTSQIQKKEEEVTKDGNTYTVINYIYKLSNIQATHDIIVHCSTDRSLYVKINSNWMLARKVLVKQSGVWIEIIKILCKSNGIWK